jgi:hypothetical protein
MLVLRRIESEIAGLRVCRAYRSLGSMIHLKFEEPSVSNVKRVQIGNRYALMVELANWTIDLNRRAIATSASANRLTDAVLRKLIGKRLRRAVFAQHRTILQFNSGLALTLTYDWASRGSKLDAWTVFRKDAAALALSAKGRFTISS